MATFDFRILLETVEGKKTSYMSQSFVDTSVDLVLSASQVYHRITGSVSCSYQNSRIFSGSDFNTSKTFKDNNLLSASLSGSLDTGSIDFISTTDDYDRLLRYKFFGEKVCTTLGLPTNQWIYVDQVRLAADDESNVFQGNIDAGNVFISDTLDFANNANINSDIPFLIDTGSDRHIKFIDERGFSTTPLIIGYDRDLDTYEISGSQDNTFNIGGVDKLIFSDGTSQTTAGGGGSADNLGNHTATQDLNLGGNDIFGVQHITASGNISASGTNNIFTAMLLGSDINHIGDSDTKIRFTDDNIGLSAGGNTVAFKSSGTNFAGHITASGNISASGTVLANELKINNTESISSLGTTLKVGVGADWTQINIGKPGAPKNILMTGPITASGNISSSENVIASGFKVDNNIGIKSYLLDGTECNVVSLNSQDFLSHGANGVRLSAQKFSTYQNAESLFITASGANTPRVGMGTSNPGKTLEVVGDISASGTIFASKLEVTEITSSIVSSSTNILIENITSSGDSIFGDTLADTHTFNGHITASGNISASNLTIDSIGIDNNIIHNSDSDTVVSFGNDSIVIRTGGITTDTSFTKGHITASGNISGSSTSTGSFGRVDVQHLKSTRDIEVAQDIHMNSTGQILLNSDNTISDYRIFAVNNTGIVIESEDGVTIPADSPFEVFNSITASADISASGTIVANELQDTSLTSGRVVIVGSNGVLTDSNKLTFDNGNITVAQNITASGNISASGELQATELHLVKAGATSNEKLLTITEDGNERFAVDEDGDVTLDGNLTAEGNIISNTGIFKGPDIDSSIQILASGIFLRSNPSDGLDTQTVAKFLNTGIDIGGTEGAPVTINTSLTAESHITASGNISSSGTITSNGGSMTDNLTFAENKGIRFIDAGQGIIGNATSITIDGDDTVNIQADTLVDIKGGLTSGVNIDGNITASGNISASGTSHTLGGDVSIGNDLTVARDVLLARSLVHDGDTGTLIQFDTSKISVTANAGIDFTGHITASGNISASGTITGLSASLGSVDINGGTLDGISSLTVTNNIDIGSHGFRCLQLQDDSLTSGRVVFAGTSGILSDDSDLTFSGDTLSATHISSTNITASGNYSGSATSTFTIGGKLQAGSKSFLIPRPEGGKLEYGVLEGQQNDVFFRGELKGDNVIYLPKEWEWLVDDNTITVQLTSIGKHQELFVKKIKENKIFIDINGMFKTKQDIHCYHIIHGTRKDIELIRNYQ